MKNPALTRKANEILRLNLHEPGPRRDTEGGFYVECKHCSARVTVARRGDSTAYTPEGTHIKCTRL